jgi:antitoxin HicB
MKIIETVAGMIRTYIFVFNPEPEGGCTVTCPTLPGLVTYGETMAQAKDMARDAMEGLIEVMLEHGQAIPESDPPQATPRFDRLAQTLREEGETEPVFESLTTKIAERV